jgi:hypothetical protein
MLETWPPDVFWPEKDLGLLATLLHELKREHPREARRIYKDFEGRLKSHSNEQRWLRTLLLRAQTVKDYEGYEAAIRWLRASITEIAPPQDGAAHLVIGTILIDEGLAGEAREELSKAVNRSLHLTGWWFRLDALEQMFKCQIMLGNRALAFEYGRAHAIESYKAGRSSARKLIEACKGFAINFNQIDYLIDLHGNVARQFRETDRHSHAAVEESEAALWLARIGLAGEAAERLLQAAADAERGSAMTDPYFAVTCRLLARYLDPAPLGLDEVVRALEDFDAEYADASLAPVLRELRDTLRSRARPRFPLISRWRDTCMSYGSRPGLPSRELMKGTILTYLTALVARYYADTEDGDGDEATLFYLTVLAADSGRNVISVLANERLIELMLREWKFKEAGELCAEQLANEKLHVYARFLFRQLAARCHRWSRPDVAYGYATGALEDLQQILEGLYVESHKVAWLSKCGSCLDHAIGLISEPVDWMDERTRRRELFRLTEIGKARIFADIASRRSYLPSPYLSSDLLQGEADIVRTMGTAMSEDEDWAPIILLHGAASPSVGGIVTVVHGDDGEVVNQFEVDPAPLRCVVLRPLHPAVRLLTTVNALPFEESDVTAARHDLFSVLP